MICKYCGKENPEGSRFCNICGSRLDDELPIMDETLPEDRDIPDDDLKEEYSFSDYLKENKKTPVVLTIALLLLITAVLLCTGIYTHRYVGGNADDTALQHASSEEVSADYAKEAIGPLDEKSLDFSKVKTISGPEKVDLAARNHLPGERQKGMDWDETLLDESGDKSEYLFVDKADGKEIFCEVYAASDSLYINKITTIKEYSEDLLEIVDYCYHEDKPCFISQRYEPLYTPVYESTDKPGVRFYFTDDVLVRSRTVVADSLLVSQTGLSLQNREDFEEFDYFTAPDAIKQQYEKFETEWLNRSYNILEAVSGSDSIGRISGRVTDAQGNALSGCNVLIQDESTGEIIYTAETASSGKFTSYVERDGRNCRICILSGDGFKDMYINDVTLDDHSAAYEFDSIRLYPEGANPCSVVLSVFDGETFKSSSAVSGILSHICLREGYNNKPGEEIIHLDTDEKGQVETTLEPGCYTAEVVSDGYITTYINIEVSAYGCKKQLFLVKKPKAGTATVLMTWDSTADLDLTVFTPYQADGGNMAHIGGTILKDEHGSSIAADNNSGCEAACLKMSGNGSYKVYVNSYSDIISGFYGSDALSAGNTTVFVVYDDGSVKSVELNSDDYGVVWEAAEVSKNYCNVRNRLYKRLGGTASWLIRKDIVKSQENVQFKSKAQITGRLEADLSYAYTDRDWINGKQFSLSFDTPVSFGMEENNTERTYKLSRINIVFDLDKGADILGHLDLHVGQYVTGTIKSTGIDEEGTPYLVLQSLSLLSSKSEDVAVPKEYLAMLADKVKDKALAYDIIYVNDNATPELVIMDPKDTSHESGAQIYTYDNGEVELIGSFGSWGGNFTYYPMKNLICTEETGASSHHESYCYFDKHTVYTVDYESSLEFPEYGISRVLGQYDMNGTEYVNPVNGRGNSVPTAVEEYEKQMKSLFRNIDRNTGIYIDTDTCLRASRIEDIRFR